MKNQYIKLFSLLIGIAAIFSGVIYVFADSYRDRRIELIKEEELIADEIADVYETFFNKEKALSDYRDEYNRNFKEFSTFYSDMPYLYPSVVEQLRQYEKLIDESSDISSFLKDKCQKKYSVLEANSTCDAYYINLEKTINLYIVDIELFNKKIDEYNAWTDKENSSVSATVEYAKLEKYAGINYTDYVDLNEDGTFLGKKTSEDKKEETETKKEENVENKEENKEATAAVEEVVENDTEETNE